MIEIQPKKDFTKFMLLDLDVWTLTFAITTLLMLSTLSIVLFLSTSTSSVIKRSTFMVISIEVSRIAIWLKS